MIDRLSIANVEFESRLMVGTGKYRSTEDMVQAVSASGAQIITVAIRRLDLDNPLKRTILDDLDWTRYTILPNTAGCKTADEAITVARLAKAMGLSNWVKLSKSEKPGSSSVKPVPRKPDVNAPPPAVGIVGKR